MGGIPRKRTEAMEVGKELCALDPEGMRGHLLGHPLSNGGRLWCDRIIEGVAIRDRTCMRLFGEAMRWTGAQVNIVAILQERLGVRDESELTGLISEGRRFRELGADRSDEEYFEAAMNMLSALLRKHPEWREIAAQRIGAASYASEENGNGHTEG